MSPAIRSTWEVRTDLSRIGHVLMQPVRMVYLRCSRGISLKTTEWRGKITHYANRNNRL